MNNNFVDVVICVIYVLDLVDSMWLKGFFYILICGDLLEENFYEL